MTENNLTPGGWSKEWEDKTYSQGAQITRYPFSNVISLVFGHFLPAYRDTPRSDLKALEVGCGTGPNLAFLAQEGMQTFGVDGSSSAIRIAQRHLAGLELDAILVVCDFTRGLPFPSESFELVLDRAAISHNKVAAIRTSLADVHRLLRPGGFFIGTTWFSTAHDLASSGTAVEDHTRTDLPPPFAGTGVAHFTTSTELQELFADFDLVYLTHSRSEVLVPACSDGSGAFSVVARKRSGTSA